MALTLENTTEQPTLNLADNSQTLSAAVHQLMISENTGKGLNGADSLRPIKTEFPAGDEHFHIPILQFPGNESNVTPSSEHGLQYRPAEEKPLPTAEQLSDEFQKVMASKDPKAVEQFKEDLGKALQEAGPGFELLVAEINNKLPKGMGIDVHDDEKPGAIDDFHHYSLRFLEQVDSGGNYQSSSYGPCEEVGSPMGFAPTPEYLKNLSFPSMPSERIID